MHRGHRWRRTAGGGGLRRIPAVSSRIRSGVMGAAGFRCVAWGRKQGRRFASRCQDGCSEGAVALPLVLHAIPRYGRVSDGATCHMTGRGSLPDSLAGPMPPPMLARSGTAGGRLSEWQGFSRRKLAGIEYNQQKSLNILEGFC